jgi:hypothetical protein
VPDTLSSWFPYVRQGVASIGLGMMSARSKRRDEALLSMRLRGLELAKEDLESGAPKSTRLAAECSSGGADTKHMAPRRVKDGRVGRGSGRYKVLGSSRDVTASSGGVPCVFEETPFADTCSQQSPLSISKRTSHTRTQLCFRLSTAAVCGPTCTPQHASHQHSMPRLR